MDNFVSRGGIKLQSAIENLTCLDVGSSAGGFVDCLLQNGAKKFLQLIQLWGIGLEAAQ